MTSVDPTIYHITHWKAGSQWIHRILLQCCPDRIVPPQNDEVQVRFEPRKEGFVYPTVYLAKPAFDACVSPVNTRTFVAIRDLRDTLISGYFSFGFSHPPSSNHAIYLREQIQSRDKEGGLIFLLDKFIPTEV